MSTDFHMSVREFDELKIEEQHLFSRKYEDEKERMLEEIEDSGKHMPVKWLRVAAAVLFLLLIPTGVYAAISYRGFLNGAWGNAGKENRKPYVETTDTDDDKPVYTAGREYAPVDEEYAKENVTPYIKSLPATVELGDTILTVNSVVRDEIGNAVVEYTLSREGGVILWNSEAGKFETFLPVLKYSNTESCSYDISFGDTRLEYNYKDEDRSTETIWYCYAYIFRDDTWYENNLKTYRDRYKDMVASDYETTKEMYAEYGIELSEKAYNESLEEARKKAEDAPGPDELVISYKLTDETGRMITRDSDDWERYKEQMKVMALDSDSLPVKCIKDDKYTAYVSPISLRLEGVNDNINGVEIEFKDGTVYRVDKDDYVNTYAECYIWDGDGDGESDMTACQFMFNRLVDIDEISKVRFDGVELGG